jgi:hypothetical protein
MGWGGTVFLGITELLGLSAKWEGVASISIQRLEAKETLNILQCTQQPPTKKELPGPIVSNSQVEKPCFKQNLPCKYMMR